MSPNNWSRDHDRILAERCGGLELTLWDELSAQGEEVIGVEEYGEAVGEWCFYDEETLSYTLIPYYNTDIAACIRAAEAWRKSRTGNWWTIIAPCWDIVGHDEYTAQLINLDGTASIGRGATPSAALAQALYEAVKG